MFANPIFLFAVFAGGVPILIHLIFRRKRRAIEYPTLIFFKRVDMKLASRRKIKERLLLALRMLVVILVALALARPGLRSTSGRGALAASADCVLIVDNSASMGLATSTGTRLDMARARAASVLDSLGPEGRAALLTTMPGEEGTEVGTLSGDHKRLRQALEGIQPTSGAGTLAAALARTQELIAASSALNREIYLFSDFQANAFRDEKVLRKAAAKIAGNARAFLCAAPAVAPASNLAIVDVMVDSRPKVAGRTVVLVAKIRNHSPRDITSTVTARLGDRPPRSAVVTVEPGETQNVPLALQLGQEGFARGEVKLEDDDAAFDNRWPLCMDVRGPIRVLVISRARAAKPEDEESFFLRKALDPTGDGALSGIRLDHVAQKVAPKDGLDAYDVIIVCGCNALPPASLAALERYVRGGGGMMIFAGARDAGLADRHPLQRFMTGRIHGEWVVTAGEEPKGLRAVQAASPYFEDLRDVDGSVTFEEAAVVKALKVQAGQGARVLAEFSDGNPAILSSKLGEGRVLWWTMSAQADDSNLPLMPSFLSLLHRGVQELSGLRSESIVLKSGTPLILDLDDWLPAADKAERPKALTIFDPKGNSASMPLASSRFKWQRTGQAGVYRIQPGEGRPGKAAPGNGHGMPKGFAITPDPEECTTKYLSPDEAGGVLAFRDARAVQVDANLPAIVSAAREGRELFGLFILAALLALLGEAFLANMIGVRAKGLGTRKKKDGTAPGRDGGTGRAEAPATETPVAAGTGAQQS